MNYKAMEWVFKHEAASSTQKLLLITLAYHVNTKGLCWPSIATLERETQLNRKTVIAGLKSLIESGYIADTGERAGGTDSIKIYRWLRTYSDQAVPETGQLSSTNFDDSSTNFDDSSTENGTAKQYRKRNQAVPFLRGSSTENGTQNNKGIIIEKASSAAVLAPVADPFLEKTKDEQVIEARLRLNPEWEIEARKRSEGKQNPQAYFNTLIVKWDSGEWTAPTSKKEPIPPTAAPPPLPDVYRGCFGPEVSDEATRVYILQTIDRLKARGGFGDEPYSREKHADLVIAAARSSYLLGAPSTSTGAPTTNPPAADSTAAYGAQQ